MKSHMVEEMLPSPGVPSQLKGVSEFQKCAAALCNHGFWSFNLSLCNCTHKNRVPESFQSQEENIIILQNFLS